MIRMNPAKSDGEPAYLDFNLRLLRRMGVWPEKGCVGRLSLLTAYLFSMYIIVYISMANQLYIAYNDIVIITECVSLVSVYVMNGHKLLSFVMYEKDYDFLIQLVKGHFYSDEQKSNPKHKAILASREKEAKFLTYVFGFLVVVCIVFFMQISTEQILTHGGDSNGTSTLEWRLPLTMVTPGVDTSSSLVFWLMYCYHSSIGMIHIVLIPACDNFLIALLVHAHGQMLILRDSLENVTKYEDLSACVRHHQTLLSYVDRLEKLMNPIMLTQFFGSSSILCITAFQLVMFPTGGIRPIGMSFFLASEMLQLGMYCYFGDKIMTESVAVGTSIYSSPWYEASPKLKKSVRIIMIRSQRPSELTMGKFMPLSIATYASIVRSSYTYFTLLNEFSD